MSTKLFSKVEVAKHNTPADGWIIVDHNVYDVSSFVNKHPGGPVLLSYLGLDATDVFYAMHPTWVKGTLPSMKVGELTSQDRQVTPVVSEFRALRKKMEDNGLYVSRKLFYARIVAISWSLFIASMYLLYKFPNSLPINMVSALLLALFWQQNGWLSHDFLHYSVFRTRLQNWVVPYIMGGMMSGYTYMWWSTKHNRHHAVPNTVDHDHDIFHTDPDIDTSPLLHWTKRDPRYQVTKAVSSYLTKLYVRNQAYFLIPLLFFARVNWTIRAMLTTLRTNNVWFYVELPSVIFYWLWSTMLPFYMLPNFQSALLFICVAQGLSGVLLAGPFVVNHNGCEIYEHDELKQVDFYTLQIMTARDITPNWFTNWFTGGLNLQIEHHMFPRCPRSNLYLVRDEVIAICKKYNIKFHETGPLQGIKEVLQTLHFVGQSAYLEAMKLQ